MKLHRFYLKDFRPENKINLNSKDTSHVVHQIVSVFRSKIKDDFIFFNCLDSCDYIYTLVNIEKKNLEFVLKDKIDKSKSIEQGAKITLCQSIIKKDNFELVVRQMVEAGISSVIPILTDRSEKKLLNTERLEKILIEATEQSGRNDLMKLEKTLKIRDILIREGEKVVFDIMENVQDVKENQKSSDLYIFIGPEGGWTDGEKKLFVKNDFIFKILPTYTLRAETAAISAVIYMLK